MSEEQDQFWEGTPYLVRLSVEEYLYFRERGDDTTIHETAKHNEVDSRLAKKKLREFEKQGLSRNGWWKSVNKNRSKCPKCGAVL